MIEPHPFGKPLRHEEGPVFNLDGVEVCLRYSYGEPDWLDIISIQSHDPGKGKAAAAIDKIIAFADEQKLSLSVYARAFNDSDGMNTIQIRDWYARCGFETSDDHIPDLTDEDHMGFDMWRTYHG